MRRLRSALQIGDQIEKAVKLLGITPEKVSEYLGRPCRCRERKRKLNQVGQWAYRVLTGDRSNAEEELNKIIDDSSKQ